MNLIQERQDLQKLLINKIQEYFKDKILDQAHTDNTLKHIFKMIITDPQLEELFKYLIKTQVNKLKQVPLEIKYSPEEETRIIKQNIKTYIEQIIKREFQLKLKNLRNHKQNSSNIDKSDQMKRKIIKKQSLKDRQQRKPNKHSQVIQIPSQSENQAQKTTLDTQLKLCAAMDKQAILTKYLSFLSSKTEEGLSELQKTTQMGHFILGDNVKTVLDIYYQSRQEKDMVLLIEWRERRDGFKPKNSMFSLKDYQYYKPLQVRLLLKKIGRGT